MVSHLAFHQKEGLWQGMNGALMLTFLYLFHIGAVPPRIKEPQ